MTMLHRNVGVNAAIPGEDCVKYVRGSLQNYKSKRNKNVLVEVVVRLLVVIKTKNIATLLEWDAEQLEEMLNVVILLEANNKKETRKIVMRTTLRA